VLLETTSNIVLPFVQTSSLIANEKKLRVAVVSFSSLAGETAMVPSRESHPLINIFVCTSGDVAFELYRTIWH